MQIVHAFLFFHPFVLEAIKPLALTVKASTQSPSSPRKPFHQNSNHKSVRTTIRAELKNHYHSANHSIETSTTDRSASNVPFPAYSRSAYYFVGKGGRLWTAGHLACRTVYQALWVSIQHVNSASSSAAYVNSSYACGQRQNFSLMQNQTKNLLVLGSEHAQEACWEVS